MRPIPQSATDDRFIQVLTEILRDYDKRITGDLMRGPTEQRPDRWEGSWFDETLGKPIWWNGTQAVDATGVVV